MSTTDPDTQTILLLAVEDRQGYTPSQVVKSGRGDVMTLATLRQLVEDAIVLYGDDARIVTDNGDKYGARFGILDNYADTFIPAEADEDEEF